MTRFLILVLSLLAFPFPFLEEPFTSWSLDEAVTVLNDSPWARQTTFTEVVEGVGSGVRGEKEIFNTFYTRILSSLPVRQAFVRVEQHAHEGLNWTTTERAGSAEVDSFTLQWIRATPSQIFCWEFPTLQNAAWVPIATTCDVLIGRSLSRRAGK